MVTDGFSHIAWLPVIDGAVIYYVLGALWFSAPLFLNQWARSLGTTVTRPGPMQIIVPAVGVIVASVVTGALAAATSTKTLADGLALGLTVGIGYAGAITFVDAGTDSTKPQPWTWFAISASYHVIGLAIVGALIGVWR